MRPEELPSLKGMSSLLEPGKPEGLGIPSIIWGGTGTEGTKVEGMGWAIGADMGALIMGALMGAPRPPWATTWSLICGAAGR